MVWLITRENPCDMTSSISGFPRMSRYRDFPRMPRYIKLMWIFKRTFNFKIRAKNASAKCERKIGLSKVSKRCASYAIPSTTKNFHYNPCLFSLCALLYYWHAQFSSKESVNQNILIRYTVINKAKKECFVVLQSCLTLLLLIIIYY